MTDRTTLADVAAAAGVSVSTASLAFSGAGPISAATKERVLAAATELGYAGPSALGRSLRSGRSGIVGVVIGDQLRRSFRDPVSVRVLDGLAGSLGPRGLGVLLVPATGDEDDENDPLVATAPLDAAVLLFGARRSSPILGALQHRGIPVVLGEGPTGLGLPVVGVADRQGTRLLAEHLRDLGHERIAVVTLPLGGARRCAPVDPTRLAEIDCPPAEHRLDGLRDAGIEPVAVVEAAASLVEAGTDAGRVLLDVADPPTAVMTQSDLLAAGVIIAARELGLRVPEDVSVAGFDGLDLPWLAPDVLTSVSQPFAAKGQAVAEMVTAILAGEQPADVELPVELRLGTTTGPPPAA
ncbi:LacI family DNA-binding transcriptional regulator [Isoptericola sp. b441]|uniref:LacI family DNA-binding transcriptional regulator n=1 Tax=Actinotalea lenta TaxID=3064654 RepID=A0ABT9D9Y3_9CELL|nr:MULTISPECIES: LacI family DNA-binding transcriptional regulator [unclassified Isoptericola]MDO8105762.1 LacI family DNA-binding transcriptional regulator [Isoptericola sp. b441]MDO8122467.1 LacI family DNA-binding transcriptional regulator [Isoptericola sp. b490]